GGFPDLRRLALGIRGKGEKGVVLKDIQFLALAQATFFLIPHTLKPDTSRICYYRACHSC
ncbi:hypothetical protein, partial [Brasilonema bromeliae]|uniref:hypothetical protein n=1 Tax=Brasilonema bromeliae TaxID=383615 RepID=UPI001B7D0A8D